MKLFSKLFDFLSGRKRQQKAKLDERLERVKKERDQLGNRARLLRDLRERQRQQPGQQQQPPRGPGPGPAIPGEPGRGQGEPRPKQTVESARWYPLVSTNVDRIRYGMDDQRLQVVFKNGSLYQFEGVEPQVFMAYLQSHSPGQYHWYVIRAYGYPYKKLSSGHSVSKPANERFDGRPFAVPKEIQDLQEKAGRGAVDRVRRARGVEPPPPAWSV